MDPGTHHLVSGLFSMDTVLKLSANAVSVFVSAAGCSSGCAFCAHPAIDSAIRAVRAVLNAFFIFVSPFSLALLFCLFRKKIFMKKGDRPLAKM